MALGNQGDRKGKMFVAWDEIPKFPGHIFYDRLRGILAKAGFDRFVEDRCAPFYASNMGRPSIPPGRYFRACTLWLLRGHRFRAWHRVVYADSLSLREFLLLDTGRPYPTTPA